MTCPNCDNGCALCRSHPYPKVTLLPDADGRIIFVEEDTGSPISVIEIYGMLVYYRAVCEFQEMQTGHLYKQMANTVPVKPVRVMEDNYVSESS